MRELILKSEMKSSQRTCLMSTCGLYKQVHTCDCKHICAHVNQEHLQTHSTYTNAQLTIIHYRGQYLPHWILFLLNELSSMKLLAFKSFFLHDSFFSLFFFYTIRYKANNHLSNLLFWVLNCWIGLLFILLSEFSWLLSVIPFHFPCHCDCTSILRCWWQIYFPATWVPTFQYSTKGILSHRSPRFRNQCPVITATLKQTTIKMLMSHVLPVANLHTLKTLLSASHLFP